MGEIITAIMSRAIHKSAVLIAWEPEGGVGLAIGMVGVGIALKDGISKSVMGFTNG